MPAYAASIIGSAFDGEKSIAATVPGYAASMIGYVTDGPLVMGGCARATIDFPGAAAAYAFAGAEGSIDFAEASATYIGGCNL